MAHPSSARTLRGGILTVTMCLVAASAAVWATAHFYVAAPTARTEVTSRADLKMSLSAGGFSPNKLAAAGVTSNNVATLVSNARSYLGDNPGVLTGYQEAVAAAQTEIERLEGLVQQGKAVEGTVTALANARSALTAAQSARATALSAFVTATEAGLSEGQKSKLATIRTNAIRPVPVQYMLTTRTQTQWLALRDALASNAVRTRAGETLDSDSNSIVVDANAEQATSTAAQSLATNLEAVSAAYTAALAGE